MSETDRGSVTLLTKNGHEVIAGETGSGKTTLAIKRVEDDFNAGHETWAAGLFSREITDLTCVDWTVTTTDDTVTMLRDLVKVIKADVYNGQNLVVTIDDATFLLKEDDVLTEVEYVAQNAPEWLKLRLVLSSTLRWGVRGSTILYDALLDGAEEVN